jgi:hypothetical protein
MQIVVSRSGRWLIVNRPYGGARKKSNQIAEERLAANPVRRFPATAQATITAMKRRAAAVLAKELRNGTKQTAKPRGTSSEAAKANLTLCALMRFTAYLRALPHRLAS